jgi:hypothetical protein
MTSTEPGAAHRALLVDDDGAVRALMSIDGPCGLPRRTSAISQVSGTPATDQY